MIAIRPIFPRPATFCAMRLHALAVTGALGASFMETLISTVDSLVGVDACPESHKERSGRALAAAAAAGAKCASCGAGICCSPGVKCSEEWPEDIATLASDLSQAHAECAAGDASHGEKGCGPDCPAENCCLSNCFSYDREYFYGSCVDKKPEEPCPDVSCSLC